MIVVNMVVNFQNDKCHIKREILDQKLKGGYHDDAAENGYVVTAQNSREIRDVTNGGVTKRSER